MITVVIADASRWVLVVDVLSSAEAQRAVGLMAL
jgi:hypothetical protein